MIRQVLRDLRRFVRGIDASDAITIVALVFVFVGLLIGSWAFAIVGALLIPLTPIGTALRMMIRGR